MQQRGALRWAPNPTLYQTKKIIKSTCIQYSGERRSSVLWIAQAHL